MWRCACRMEIKDLFQEWLATDHPDRASRVMSLVRQMRGGKDYDSQWGKRMKGEGPHRRPDVPPLRHRQEALRPGRQLGDLDLTQFRVPPKAGRPDRPVRMSQRVEHAHQLACAATRGTGRPAGRARAVKPASIRVRASRAKVAGLQETPMTRATGERASSAACSAAPARGGSKTATSTRFSSSASTGRRTRSRASAVTPLQAGRGGQRGAQRADRLGREIGGMDRRDLAPARKVKVPTPQ